MFDRKTTLLVKDVLDRARDCGMTIATAESCTGGLVAAALTSVAGSSDVVERGFVTYSNVAKHEMLGVPNDMIEAFGAVSEQVARAMAEGALRHSDADLAVSITGIAGPGGGSAEKPVGLVHIAAARRDNPTLHTRLNCGDTERNNVRIASLHAALDLLIGQLSSGVQLA